MDHDIFDFISRHMPAKISGYCALRAGITKSIYCSLEAQGKLKVGYTEAIWKEIMLLLQLTREFEDADEVGLEDIVCKKLGLRGE